MDDDQLVEPFITTRLDHQCGIDDCDPVWIFAFPFAQDLVLTRDDERMQDVVQSQTLFFIGKDDRGHAGAVERSVWRQNLFAKALRSEEHTSELQSQSNLVCRLLLEKKKKKIKT